MSRSLEFDFDAAREREIAERRASLPPHNGSATSIKAAASMIPRAGSQRRIVYDAIRAAGERGMTREEIRGACGMSENAVHPRVWELLGNPRNEERAPLIAVAAFLRRTESGRDAEVLVAIDQEAKGAA